MIKSKKTVIIVAIIAIIVCMILGIACFTNKQEVVNIDEENAVNVAIVGKYVQLEDSYLSVIESLKHAGFANNVNVKIDLIDSETITKENGKGAELSIENATTGMAAPFHKGAAKYFAEKGVTVETK